MEHNEQTKLDKRFAWLYFDILCIIIVLIGIEVVLFKILHAIQNLGL